MTVKVLPIYKYPFKNVQNQLVGEYNEVGDDESLFFDLVHYNYNIYMNTAFNEYAPTVHSTQIGSTNFKFRFSKENFSGIQIFDGLDMKQIKFFIFEVKEQNQYKYYYYYVEDMRIINEKLYEYDLTIDVMKTYFREILAGFRNVKPLRYFQKTYEYFNFNKYSNYDIIDPLIPKQTDISSKVKLCHYVIDGRGSHFFTGTWTYFYMKFSSEDNHTIKNTYGYEGQDFFILVMPKYCDVDNYGNLPIYNDIIDNKIFNTTIYNFLLNSQFLIKAVDSDIPPFNNKLEIKNSNWEITYDNIEKTWNIKINGEKPAVLTPYEIFTGVSTSIKSHIFIRSNISSTVVFPKGLLNELKQSFPQYDDDDFDKLSLMFVIKRNPNNESKDNELIKYHSSLENGVQDVDYPIYQPRLNITRSFIQNDNVVNAHRELNKLFSNYEIGYQNSNKLPIDISLIENNQNLKFTSIIRHDLMTTEELIMYVNSVNENEIFTKRSSEIRRTKVVDEFQNYLYQNSNSLTIKEKQLNVWNDVKAIASGAMSIASSAITKNAMGVGFAVYNTTMNLFDNELQRQQHKAKMNDLKKTPLAYEAGNFNTDINYLNILPVLNVYRNSKTINYEDENANLDDREIYELIKFYGFYTPLNERKEFWELFTRRLYNYIQVIDANEILIEQHIDIPNQHLTMIFDVLENGVRFWTLSYIENPNQSNGEAI